MQTMFGPTKEKVCLRWSKYLKVPNLNMVRILALCEWVDRIGQWAMNSRPFFDEDEHYDNRLA
jgi:hypothetical protein